MSKTYNLTATLNTGRLTNSSWQSDAWTNFFHYSDDPVGYSGYDAPRYYATNMLFDQTTLASLRSKSNLVSSVTLEVNCVQPMTGETYIGYKYNSTASGTSTSAAWARSTNVDNPSSAGDTSDTLAYIIPAQSLSAGTKTFTLKGTSDGIPFAGVPKYGLVAGPRRLVSGRWRFTSAILHVTTSEVTISYKKGTSGSGTEYTDVAAPNSNLRGAIFTRTGYTQTGWATSDGGAKVYNLSAQYTGTADLTLYPYWTAVTYTVTYAPGSYSSGSNYTDTKTYGVALTLRGATYTRANYSQDGWSVNSNGSTKDYNLSGSYTNNAQITLYPHWKADTYTVSYNANGGTGAPAAQTKTYGVNLTLSSTAPTRTNYIFQGWATSSTGAVAYQPGGTYSTNAAVTLYAIWQPASAVFESVTSEVEIGKTNGGTITWTNAFSAYHYWVRVTISGANKWYQVPGTAPTSYTFTIPSSWLSYVPNSESITATVGIYTYLSDDTTIVGHSDGTCTLTVASSVKPIISSFTHSPYSQNSTVNGWGVYVQGYSQVDLSVAASAGTGASIVSIAFSGTGVSQSGTATTARSSVLSNTGYLDYSVTVTDSRGRSATSSLSGTGRPYFYEYSNPVVTAMTAFRSNSSGVEDAISGTYIRTSASFMFSSCGNKNSLSVKKIEYKLHTASSWTSGVATATSGTAYTIGGGNIAITSSYDVRCTVTDALSHTTTYVVLVPPIVGFAVGLNNDRARFGGPVEKAGLQVDWDAEFNGVVDVVPRRCYATLSSAGWYRILTSSVTPRAGQAFDIDFHINTSFYNSTNQSHIITLQAVYDNFKFVNEQSLSNSATIVDKIRCMRTADNMYVDIHYYSTTSNHVSVDFDVHVRHDYKGNFTATNFSAVGPSPSGETELALYTFAANTEGTITTPSAGVSGSQVIDSNCRRSGKVVSYHMSISSTSSSEISVSHGSVLATGLVPPDYMVITLGQYWVDTSKPNLRCRVTTAGNLEVYWDSGVIPKSGQSVIFEITYIAA